MAQAAWPDYPCCFCFFSTVFADYQPFLTVNIMNKKTKSVVIGAALVAAVVLIAVSVLCLRQLFYHLDYYAKLKEISADNLEIEKKWLVNPDDVPFDLDSAEVTTIEQTYISFSPEIRVRRLNGGEFYTLTMKSNMSDDGLVRDETEIYISEKDYTALMGKKEGSTIFKTRYQLLYDGQLMALDIFAGSLEGLACLEIEFENTSAAEACTQPDWVIKEVTDDILYKNGSLARYGIPDSFYEYTNN